MIVVTGATGFVGKRLAQLLPKYYPGEKVLCLVWSKDTHQGTEARAQLTKLGYRLKMVDLATGQGLQHLPRAPRLIIHLAATTDTSVTNHRCNDIGTANLLAALPKLSPQTHFVHISTIALHAGRVSCRLPLDENSSFQATNEYGRTKQRAEGVVTNASLKQGFPLTIIRLNTVWGSFPRVNSMFEILRRSVVDQSFITRINWPGLTSLVHVDNVAEIILELSKKPPADKLVISLSAEALTFQQICKKMYQLLNIDYRLITIPPIIWQGLKIARHFIPLLEKVLPTTWYNPIWRAGLIVDNVVYSKSLYLHRLLPEHKFKTFAESGWNVLI